MLEPERFGLLDAVVPTEWGFDLAPSETALASRESRRAPADEFILRRQLDPVDGYHAVLVDCPPSLGWLTINALAAASRLIVVTEPSFLALQGIEELLDTIELVRTHYNSRLQLAGSVRVSSPVGPRASRSGYTSPRAGGGGVRMASAPSRRRRAASLRSWSARRRDATVTNHARGFSGHPCTGHWAVAATSASWTASSQASKWP